MKRSAIRWLVVAAGLGVVFFATIAGISHWHGEPHYTTQTIPVWAGSSHVQNNAIWWIDNDRVVFTGADANVVVPSDDPGRPFELMAIYLWDIKRNEAKRYAELNILGRMVCHERGTIKYYVQGPVDKAIGIQPVAGYQGLLGQAPLPWDARPPEDGGAGRGEWMTARFGCGALWETDLVRPEHAMRENIIWPLWPEDGYLYSPSNSREKNYDSLMSTSVEMWRPGAKSGITLPITIKEMANSTLYYSEFRNVYVLPAGVRRDETRSHVAGYLPGKERPVYFISRNGDVETKRFPNENWVAAGGGFLPTVAGYLVVSNFSSRAQSRDAGAWLVTDGRPYKLIDHLVDESSVSPDGCKAIVSIHNPDKEPRFSRAMTVFNFCDAEGGK